MDHTTQTIELLFNTIVSLKSKEDESKSLSDLLAIPEYSKSFLFGLRDKYSKVEMESVSIVTCTRKPNLIRNVLKNYRNQVWAKKELIIILNRDDMDISIWKKITEKDKNIFIYQLPEEMSLGHCYNFAVEKTNYDYIATFDDDDYYAPNYLTDLMYAFLYTDADIVGKRAYYAYLEETRLLVLRHAAEEYKYLEGDLFLDGGKKIMKRKVFDHVQYRNVSNLEDVYICQDSIQKGFKVFSADKYNLVYLRKANKNDHTWKGEDDEILRWLCTVIAHTDDYKKRVTI